MAIATYTLNFDEAPGSAFAVFKGIGGRFHPTVQARFHLLDDGSRLQNAVNPITWGASADVP